MAMKEDHDSLRYIFRQFMSGKETVDASNSQAIPHNQAKAPHVSATPSPAASFVVPKFTRLEFPRYDGRDDPIGWIHHCEQLFKAQSTLANEYVSMAAFHLIGVAQMWHFRLELEEPKMS